MTLRRRLTLAYVGFFAIALIALDIGLYLIVRQALYSSIDSDLKRGAQYLQDGFTSSNEQLRASNNQRLKDYFGANRFILTEQTVSGFDATNLKFQVYQPNGELVAKSPNVQYTIHVDDNLLDQALVGQDTLNTIDNANMRTRQLLQPLLFRGQVVGALQLTRSLRDTDFALRLLLYVLLGGGAIVLLTAARGGAWLTRAAFKPIDEVTRTAQSIVRAEDLSRRVPVPTAPDELQRLTTTVNDLLARLEGLFSAQRRFVADVSHELRTPLAAMQGNLEVLDRGAARDPELLAESLADMRREVA
ncbi:MAG: histidine kinase dimerization/phospho-acceptor domain-containing protein, partial [Roseiflexaceae bacterium]